MAPLVLITQQERDLIFAWRKSREPNGYEAPAPAEQTRLGQMVNLRFRENLSRSGKAEWDRMMGNLSNLRLGPELVYDLGDLKFYVSLDEDGVLEIVEMVGEEPEV